METARFAFVIDGEFVGGMQTSDAHPMFEHMCAVMRSNPEIVEILPSDPNFSDVKEGWIYSNGTWSEPLPG